MKYYSDQWNNLWRSDGIHRELYLDDDKMWMSDAYIESSYRIKLTEITEEEVILYLL